MGCVCRVFHVVNKLLCGPMLTKLSNPWWHVVNCAGTEHLLSLSVSVSLFFLLEITLRSSLSPSISFDYPHAKIQIPQDTNSLSRHNYKMLYASVNSTSVTVTVCICHEMRQKRDEFALVKRDEGGSLFCALLADCAKGVCSSLITNEP